LTVAPRPWAFTLLELLVVIAILGTLAALLLPALALGKLSARSAQCGSNLHQLSLAAQMYWDDHEGICFRWSSGSTNGGQRYWFGWLGPGAEGSRTFDASQGVLYPYLAGSKVRLCPALDYALAQFKLKATGSSYGYGYNLALSPPNSALRINNVRRTTETTLFGDAAQVNDFQAPASPLNPMLEEWYYLDNPTNMIGRNYYPHAHFRHQRRANVAFCDGHVGTERFMEGSLDPRLPSQFVGRLRPEILVLP
jgi:prepilin-type processing-associated H-X9-DG protein/prepilin-type N-terminal cleavage/methylation domain-containing protein